ncbi:MAG: dTDP-4-dehydrorhamnose reductase [Verrucomicrobia bacterium]|nr:dTDP-4-dehydrorhamnose reductase [Verrucomicrobiota bacterium]
MKVTVIGARGMLGSDLVRVLREKGIETFGFDLPDVDILHHRNLRTTLPYADWVINCAAYTRVDDAETERQLANDVNAKGPRILAMLCKRWQMRLMQISTDYVFDGLRSRPYTEQDRTNPLSIYGASKLAGEKAIRSMGVGFMIARTQSLFGRNGTNFVKAIVRKLRSTDDPVRVVKDQISSPTYTVHLADALSRLLDVREDGIVHVSAGGQCSWYEFAVAIRDRIKPDAEIVPVSSSEFKSPAPRPPYSVLDNHKYRGLTGHRMPTWEEGLDAYLKEEGLIS